MNTLTELGIFEIVHAQYFILNKQFWFLEPTLPETGIFISKQKKLVSTSRSDANLTVSWHFIFLKIPASGFFHIFFRINIECFMWIFKVWNAGEHTGVRPNVFFFTLMGKKMHENSIFWQGFYKSEI